MSMPTLQDCISWRDALDGEWGNLDSEMTTEEDLYFQKFEVDTPGGRLAVKTGSAPSDADAAIDSIVPADILVKVRPARAKEKYKKQADKQIRFGKGLINHWRRLRDPFRTIATDMAIRRVGICRVLVDKSLWPDVPVGVSDTPDADGESPKDAWVIKHRKCPIILERRNPRYTRWRMADDGTIMAVVEKYMTTVLEARSTLGHYEATAKILRGRQPNDTVEVSDVWVGKYRCLLIQNEPLFPKEDGKGKSAKDSTRGVVPHGYSEIPYAIAPFRELSFDEPDRRYRGMLTNAAQLYPMESQVLSMQVSMLAWNAWRTFIGWTNDGRPLEIIPGQYIPIDPKKGEYLEMLQGDPIPDEVLQTAAVIDSYIQRNGVAQGPVTAEGTRSGQQVWAIQAMRQLKIEAARQSLIRMTERALQLAAMMLEENVREPITLPVPGRDKDGNEFGESTTTPADIDGYRDGWIVSYGKRLDPAILEQAKALSALAANNWMPLQVSWELSGLVDVPQDWEDQLYMQATDRLPFILELAGLARVEKWYGAQDWRYITMAQKIMESKQQQAAMSSGGAPGMATGGTMQPPSMQGPTGTGGQLGAMTALSKSARPTGNVRGNKTPGGGAAGGAPPAM